MWKWISLFTVSSLLYVPRVLVGPILDSFQECRERAQQQSSTQMNNSALLLTVKRNASIIVKLALLRAKPLLVVNKFENAKCYEKNMC